MHEHWAEYITNYLYRIWGSSSHSVAKKGKGGMVPNKNKRRNLKDKHAIFILFPMLEMLMRCLPEEHAVCGTDIFTHLNEEYKEYKG
jgi:hypothetical protein